MKGLSSPQAFLLILLPIALITGGCASSQSTSSDSRARAAAIGTWEYRVTGNAPLDRGTFQISVENGRLKGTVRDQRRGRFRAQVDVSGSRMELTVGRLRISGKIEDERFSGFLRLQQWDVSTSSRRRRRQSGLTTASLYAERVRSGGAAGAVPALDCRSILREADGCK